LSLAAGERVAMTIGHPVPPRRFEASRSS
jgi:hypothetical protein